MLNSGCYFQHSNSMDEGNNMAADKDSLRRVRLQEVRPNPAALRDVKTDSTDFLQLVESIKSKGIVLPIAVREEEDKDTHDKYLALVDGLQRWTGAREAGLDEIPVHVIDVDEIEALETQIVTNSHFIQTKPAQFSEALNRLLKF